MNSAPSGRSTTLAYIIGFFFINPTAKVIGTIIVEHDEIQLFGITYYGQKIGTNCSKTRIVWSNIDIPALVIFEYRNPYIFF